MSTEKASSIGQIFVAATGCRDILVGERFENMPNDAIVCCMLSNPELKSMN
jgi:adenosylhomocysteinase